MSFADAVSAADAVLTDTPLALRLNLGCWVPTFWRSRDEGWVNIDLNPAYSPDLVADCCALPYADATVDEIYAGHLLEHIPQHQNALAEWRRVLKPGAPLLVVVPDIARALELFHRGAIDRTLLYQVAFGGADDSPLQLHRRIYTGRLLLNEMAEAGFSDLHLVPDDGVLWQIGVRGVRPPGDLPC